MKILITGSAGYVGGIIKEYFKDKHEIDRVDLLTSGDPDQIKCDSRDSEAVASIAERLNPAVVIHAVGNKDIGFCENNPKEAYQINSDTVKNIALAFGNKSKII